MQRRVGGSWRSERVNLHRRGPGWAYSRGHGHHTHLPGLPPLTVFPPPQILLASPSLLPSMLELTCDDPLPGTPLPTLRG